MTNVVKGLYETVTEGPTREPYRLDPEVKAKWLAALRSGEYRQATGRLHKLPTETTEGGYCCLGVLCNIMGAEESPSETGKSHAILTYEGTSSGDTLPRALAEKVGISAGGALNSAVRGDDDCSYYTLWELNDCAGFDFNQIAAVIEEQF